MVLIVNLQKKKPANLQRTYYQLSENFSTISKHAKNIQNLTAFFDSKATNLEVSKKSISSHRGCRPATSQVLQILFKCFNKSAPVTSNMIEMLQTCFKTNATASNILQIYSNKLHDKICKVDTQQLQD